MFGNNGGGDGNDPEADGVPLRRSLWTLLNVQCPDTSGSINKGDTNRKPCAPERHFPASVSGSPVKPGILKGENPASESAPLALEVEPGRTP